MDMIGRRLAAANESRGTSDAVIYDVVLTEIERSKRGGAILDFGAGTGTLAQALAATGQFERIVAIDLYDYGAVRGQGVQWVLSSDLNEPVPLADDSFDVLVAVEVIEHLENPREVAREWHRLLRPGGLLIATTPNVESWRSLLSLVVRGHFIAFTDRDYPAHITALTRADLCRSLCEAGFAEVRFFFTNQGAVPKMTSLTWQTISCKRLRGLRYSDNVGVVAAKPISTG